jgi:hypothetical protein
MEGRRRYLYINIFLYNIYYIEFKSRKAEFGKAKVTA